MAFDSTGEVRWQIPEGYYQQIAQSDVNGAVHLAGRLLVAPMIIVMYGTPIITWSQGFVDAKPEFDKGNVIMATGHRSDWETVIGPARYERVGLHHARPVAKLDPLFQNPLLRATMHGLGSFAIDKRSGHADMQGLLEACSGILQRGGIINFYMEGARITEDPLQVKAGNIKVGGILAAVMNDSLVVPNALAGLSKEKVGKGSDAVTVARDKRSWFGMRRPLVLGFDTPFKFEQPDFDPTRILADRHLLTRPQFRENADYLRTQAEVVSAAMQRALDRAYEIRGTSLEEKHDTNS